MNWSFRFSISPSNEYSGLISIRIDWFDLLVVQGTLKSLLQHQSSKASILWRSALFMVQLSHPYLTTGKTIALTSLVLFLWLFWERICLQCGRPVFDLWVGKIPWRREWLTHSSILSWRIPWTMVHRVPKSRT